MTNKKLENKINKLSNKDYSIYRKNLYSNDIVDEIEYLIKYQYLQNDKVLLYKNLKTLHDQLYKMFS